MRIATRRFGTARQKMFLERWGNPKLPRVRVHVSTGYHPVEGNRRASRNGRVSSSLPPEAPSVTAVAYPARAAPPAAPAPATAPPRGRAWGGRGSASSCGCCCWCRGRGAWYCDAKVANREIKGLALGREWLFNDGQIQSPLAQSQIAARFTIVPEGFWICPSFKDHFLSRRVKP